MGRVSGDFNPVLAPGAKQPLPQIFGEAAAHQYVETGFAMQRSDNHTRLRQSCLGSCSGAKDTGVQVERAAFGK